MVTLVRRACLSMVLLIGAALVACAPVGEPGRPPIVTDPPPEVVADALRFGDLAPLPPGARVVALRHEADRDPSVVLAVRMPEDAAEPYLVASGLGSFDELAVAGGQTVDDRWLPRTTPTTAYTYAENSVGDSVGREGFAEPVGDGVVVLHLRLLS